MAQNVIVKNRDNPVVILFSGVDLTQADDIQVELGADSWNMINDPQQVVVVDETTLNLFLRDTTERGKKALKIVVFDSENPNGYEVTSPCQGNLMKVRICE